ncbi:MAG: fimbrial protein [Rhodanobacteraceae bacterium]
MNLKPALLAAAIVAVSSATLLAPAAHAVTSPAGTINFNGRVVANSCVITVTGGTASAAGGAATGLVTLPTVYTTDFGGVGTFTGTTPFSISLTGCDTSFTSAQTLWNAGGNLSASGGRLKNTSGSNVDVQLLNGSNAAMDLSQGTATAQGSQTVSFSSGAATLNYSARYYATAAATTAGAVNTSVQFTMIYQ